MWTQQLPDLTRRERDCSLAVITKLERYPFAARTPGPTTPTSATVQTTLADVPFYRQPYPRTNFTVWLFETAEARDKFVDVFVAEVL